MRKIIVAYISPDFDAEQKQQIAKILHSKNISITNDEKQALIVVVPTIKPSVQDTINETVNQYEQAVHKLTNQIDIIESDIFNITGNKHMKFVQKQFIRAYNNKIDQKYKHLFNNRNRCK